MAEHDAHGTRDSRPLSLQATWRWASPEAQAVLAPRDLAAIIRFHRRVHGQSQSETGVLIGYDKTYISAIELGKRRLTDTAALRHIAPAPARPRRVARQAGHASQAVAELGPLQAVDSGSYGVVT